MEGLLKAINDGDLTWADLEGAVITEVDEKIEGDKYVTDLTVTIGYDDYLWTIIGQIAIK